MSTARRISKPRPQPTVTRPGRVPDTAPALVVNVSLLDPSGNYDERISFLEREIRIVRIGTAGGVEEAHELVRKWSGSARAIAVTGVREARATGQYTGDLDGLTDLHRTSA